MRSKIAMEHIGDSTDMLSLLEMAQLSYISSRAAQAAESSISYVTVARYGQSLLIAADRVF